MRGQDQLDLVLFLNYFQIITLVVDKLLRKSY